MEMIRFVMLSSSMTCHASERLSSYSCAIWAGVTDTSYLPSANSFSFSSSM